MPDPSHLVFPLGLSWGELALLYVRERLATDPPRVPHRLSDSDQVTRRRVRNVEQSLWTHMHIDVNRYRLSFDKHIKPQLFQHPQWQKRVSQALKAFLDEIRRKNKGYTASLKKVMHEILFTPDADQWV